MKVYIASSWRNDIQPGIVHMLRRCGHDVYDFRNPPDNTGFSWTQVDSGWVVGSGVSAEQQRTLTGAPVAVAGYASDLKALTDCDALLYLLPCGKSASWEFGYAMAQGKKCFVLWMGMFEPELMFREATILANVDEMFDAFGGVPGEPL